MFVVRCLLVVACFAVLELLCDVSCSLVVACCVLFTVCRLALCVECCVLCVACCVLCVVCCLLYVAYFVRCLRFAGRPLSFDDC